MIRKFARSITLALSLGTFGGAVLVLCFMFFTSGKYILIPWAAIVLATTALIRAEKISTFAERFATGLIAFMLASLALYVAVVVSNNGAAVGVAGHAWRLGLLLAVGVAVNLPAARIARPQSEWQAA